MFSRLYLSRVSKFLFFIMVLAGILGPATAYARVHHHAHHPRHHRSYSGGRPSYADIVIDAETGRILHATNADQLRHPASLTKMMTLYLTFQALESGRLQLNQYLPVSANASEQSPSKLGLRRGERIRVEDAIMGLVTQSANDAAVVIAEALGGNDRHFAQMMTKQAHALGMTHTRFDNPNGLPDAGQVTTARDMAILGHALIYHFPAFYPYFSRDSFAYDGYVFANHNHLMERYSGMDGIKTGYIRASGFNLVASAVRGHTRLIGVVFGGRSATARDNQMALLLDQAFAKIENEGVAQNDSEGRDQDYAQGDGSDVSDASDYVALPAKIAVVFPPPGAPVAAGGWGIQVGAYSDPAMGRQALSNLVRSMPQWLGSAGQVVEKVSAGSVTMYRARLMGLDEKTARAACTYMARHQQSCLTVAPEITVAN